MRAERRLGELITLQKETVGLAQGKRTDLLPVEQEVQKPTLSDAGISWKLSSHAQKVASIPEQEFESIVGDWRESLETANYRHSGSYLNGTRCPIPARLKSCGANIGTTNLIPAPLR